MTWGKLQWILLVWVTAVVAGAEYRYDRPNKDEEERKFNTIWKPHHFREDRSSDVSTFLHRYDFKALHPGLESLHFHEDHRVESCGKQECLLRREFEYIREGWLHEKSANRKRCLKYHQEFKPFPGGRKYTIRPIVLKQIDEDYTTEAFLKAIIKDAYPKTEGLQVVYVLVVLERQEVSIEISFPLSNSWLAGDRHKIAKEVANKIFTDDMELVPETMYAGFQHAAKRVDSYISVPKYWPGPKRMLWWAIGLGCAREDMPNINDALVTGGMVLVYALYKLLQGYVSYLHRKQKVLPTTQQRSQRPKRKPSQRQGSHNGGKRKPSQRQGSQHAIVRKQSQRHGSKASKGPQARTGRTVSTSGTNAVPIRSGPRPSRRSAAPPKGAVVSNRKRSHRTSKMEHANKML